MSLKCFIVLIRVNPIIVRSTLETKILVFNHVNDAHAGIRVRIKVGAYG